MAGLLIAAMGLPGSGKSAVFRALAQSCNLTAFYEPEERCWPRAVTERETCGHFTALTWFRTARAPLLFEADRLRNSGQIVLVDSYFDKLIAGYIDKPGIEWLIAPTDPYYPIAVHLAKVDLEALPDADAVVFFEVTESTWRSFLDARGRTLDSDPEFLGSFKLQPSLLESTRAYCEKRGATFVLCQQSRGTPESAADALRLTLNSRFRLTL